MTGLTRERLKEIVLDQLTESGRLSFSPRAVADEDFRAAWRESHCGFLPPENITWSAAPPEDEDAFDNAAEEIGLMLAQEMRLPEEGGAE